MAKLSTHHRYYNGWTQKSSLINNLSTLGPYDGGSKCRSVFKISLNSITSVQERTTMTVSITTVTVDADPPAFNDSFYYNLTSSGPGSSHSVQGTSYDSGSTETFSSQTNYSRTTSFEIDISGVPYGTNTVYLWMYANCSTGGRYSLYTTTDFSVSESDPIDIITPVTTGSITTLTEQFFKPSQEITVNWNSGSGDSTNSIEKYSTKLKVGSTTYGPYETTATSYDFSITSATRGDSVTAYVQAIGSVSGYNGDVVSKTLGKINKQPNAPTSITSSGDKLTPLTSITYSNIPISDPNNTIDTDGNFDATYYKIGSNGEETKITQSSLTITVNSGVESGSNNIIFYTKDECGEECEQPVSFNFQATFKPEVGSNISVNHNTIPGMVLDENFATKTDITFDMASGSALSVNLYLKTADSIDNLEAAEENQVDTNYYTYTQGSNINTISITNANLAYLVAPGKYFQFSFEAKDSSSESDKITNLAVGRRPKTPRLPTYDSRNTGAISKRAKDNYFKNSFQITYTNQSSASGYVPISSVKLRAKTAKTPYEVELDKTNGQKTANVVFDKILPNTSADFYFIVVDNAGQQSESSNKLFTLTQSSSLSFTGNSVGVDNYNLMPSSNTSPLQISHPKAESTGTLDNAMIYKYYLKYESNIVEINEYGPSDLTDSSTIWIKVEAEDINAFAQTLFPGSPNEAYKVIIMVEAEDGFGEKKTLTIPQDSFTINFTEPPYFVDSSAKFSLKHYYYTNGTDPIYSGEDIPTLTSTDWSSIRDKIMVNSGEGIVFKLPKAADPNNDISEYRIYLARGDFESVEKVPTYKSIDISNFKHLITIPLDQLEENKDEPGYYFYRYTASKYSKNEYFYFGAKVFDATTNSSNFIGCEQCIIGCRTTEPTFSTGDIKAERREETDETSTITLTYNFQITDLGGSATKNGWNSTFYNSCPNFERSLPKEYEDYKNKVYLKIEIAPSQNFESDLGYQTATQEIVCSNGLINASSTSQTFANIKPENFPINSKIFMRFTLTVPFGMQSPSTEATEGTEATEATVATISSAPNVFTYFGSVPTVAHRVHKVGINTTSLGPDDVMVIENYQGTKFVRFKGTDALDAAVTQEIVFDLLRGTVNGLIIDCGEW